MVRGNGTEAVMAYEPSPEREVVAEHDGYGAGVMAGAILVVAIILLVGLYLVGGLAAPRTGRAPQQQPAPSLQVPSVASSR
jgi:hypothetical protein